MKRNVPTVAVRLVVAMAIVAGGSTIGTAADAPPAVLAVDTPSTTSSGVTFTAPKSWSVRRAASMIVLTAPEGDFSNALVDVGPASDAAAAVVRAWQAYRPDAKRTVKLVTAAPARNGWDARSVVDYEVSPNEHALVQAIAYRHGDAWTVAILEGSEATAEERAAAVNLVVQSAPQGTAASSSRVGPRTASTACVSRSSRRSCKPQCKSSTSPAPRSPSSIAVTSSSKAASAFATRRRAGPSTPTRSS